MKNFNEGGQNNLLESIGGLLSNSGGLNGLVENFKQKGLGDVVSSWISTGKNLPISAEQIQSVLGHSQVQQIAEKLGVSTQDASNHIAEYLPQIIDKITPGGSLPTEPDQVFERKGFSGMSSFADVDGDGRAELVLPNAEIEGIFILSGPPSHSSIATPAANAPTSNVFMTWFVVRSMTETYPGILLPAVGWCGGITPVTFSHET